MEPGPWAAWEPVVAFELRAFLIARIADGFVFPLNPKWILCDEGWYGQMCDVRCERGEFKFLEQKCVCESEKLVKMYDDATQL